VSDKYNKYAKEVLNQLNNYDIRALIDERNEKVGRKIRDAEVDKIPYMLIVGEDEERDGTVSVRKQGDGDKGSQSIESFANLINEEIKALLGNL